MKNDRKTWDNVYKNGRKFSKVRESTLDALGIRGKKTILDVGCGQGELMNTLRARGFEVSGIDLSSYSADMVGNFLTAKLGKYDIIFANLVIAFNPIKQFLKVVRDHLNENGRFVVVTPVIYPEETYNDHWKSISVDYHRLIESLNEFFGKVDLVDKYKAESGYVVVFSCKSIIKSNK